MGHPGEVSGRTRCPNPLLGCPQSEIGARLEPDSVALDGHARLGQRFLEAFPLLELADRHDIACLHVAALPTGPAADLMRRRSKRSLQAPLRTLGGWVADPAEEAAGGSHPGSWAATDPG